MGVSHRPGFGLLGSVPRSLSTQPPFATQALNIIVESKKLVLDHQYMFLKLLLLTIIIII